ncbi:DUF2167 domain-containing protein [Xanthomonas campestris]|uniref:DUF2167 domain-containing protein n=1 Tax=Xanthomonas campestris TaxID=339 RepID=UPI00021AEE7F|nr:DUF2167 domain-containing protein [Xanthomonas campestris]AEL09027.1 conserved hypothetical protein [Xanthomonas campestris pv. raphani 756C]MEA9776126.1 DUF2167 domain-containing protein [Xanthomonas campestris pv. raphani]MEA9917647.1 DUF2167 domain-containing protein [Xanthomonas campestris pv. raphani]
MHTTVVLRGLLAACLLVASPLLFAIPADAVDEAQVLAALQYRDGHITVPQAKAHFDLDPTFRYLDKADTRRVLEQLWGNPPDDSVLGMIVPRTPALDAPDSWAVVVTYSDEGYVSDEDAAKIDYSELLADMQKGTAEENAARHEKGYGTVDLLGWAVPPRYDAGSKKLYWAKELRFDGAQQHTLNYDIRVLGRSGYLNLNAVAGIGQLDQVRQGMQQLLPMTEFDHGARYADHNPSTDKIASYGLAGLIGGGLAAKAGLFAKLGLLLAKGWKLVLFGVLALGAGIRRVFAGRKANGNG